MIGTAKHMTIDLEKDEGFPAHAEELAVFVEHNGVTKSVLENDLHDCRCISRGVCVMDRLHCGECAHAAGRDKVM